MFFHLGYVVDWLGEGHVIGGARVVWFAKKMDKLYAYNHGRAVANPVSDLEPHPYCCDRHYHSGSANQYS